MRLILKSFIPVFLALLIISGCHHKTRTVQRSVYYWQTAFNITDAQFGSLQNLGINTIYTRFFDVVYDAENKVAKPVADIRFDTKPPQGTKIVPVVFIRNKVLENASDEACKSLAVKICHKVNLLVDSNQLEQAKELQIDCDWTIETKTRFFELLLACKKTMPDVMLSCTIRLHQVKYFKGCGVPPVDRGMLMFYNMGNLSSLNEKNSIYDPGIAHNYLVNFENYPLHLDVAVPLFDMAILYRANKPVNTVSPEITANQVFKRVKDNLFIAERDTFIDLINIRAGDIIKQENCDLVRCREASKQIAPYLQSNQFTVSIFDLQPSKFFKYDTSAIAQVYNAFR